MLNRIWQWLRGKRWRVKTIRLVWPDRPPPRYRVLSESTIVGSFDVVYRVGYWEHYH